MPVFTFTESRFGSQIIGHAVAALSGYFPDGEEFFVRSVRYYTPLLRDPLLRRRVRWFCGQETAHAAAHVQLNDVLAARGYLVQAMHSRGVVLPALVERLTPPIARLAQTAAMEHYTAILAARMLAHRDGFAALIGDPEITRLLAWHAFEELEHKAVAFDVYRAVRGPEWLRIAAMAVITVIAIATTLLLLGVSIVRDRTIRAHPIQAWRAYKTAHALWFPGITADVLAYMRPGFHPDHIDTRDLLTAYTAGAYASPHEETSAGGSVAGRGDDRDARGVR